MWDKDFTKRRTLEYVTREAELKRPFREVIADDKHVFVLVDLPYSKHVKAHVRKNAWTLEVEYDVYGTQKVAVITLPCTVEKELVSTFVNGVFQAILRKKKPLPPFHRGDSCG